ncbi:hypothetical protein OA172_00100 [Euryarchaeota archaeon]|nr:hypothetical protein [Euryarchaeota archaeon]
MIPWFFSIDEFQEFKRMNAKKRQKIIDAKAEEVRRQKALLEETTRQLRTNALAVARRVKRKDQHRATEEMMTVAFDLKNAEPIITNYVNSRLLLRVYQIMHIDGYEDPSALPEAMADIDYGLYSLSTEDELRSTLRRATDPLAIIGIEL